jgi:hypothetical protein
MALNYQAMAMCNAHQFVDSEYVLDKNLSQNELARIMHSA